MIARTPERLPWTSRLRADLMVLPVGAMIGITESREEIDLGLKTIERSLNGTAVELGVLFGTVFRNSLSASGPALRWTPALSRLPRTGPFLFDSTLHLDAAIPAGASSVTLQRDVVPGSRVLVFRAWDRNEAPVPFTLAGRVLTLAAPADTDLYVAYRPRLTVVLKNRGSSAPEVAGTKDWTLVVEEYRP
ncbi:hypothetical protein ACUXK4_004537 [Methylorubrum extorquens]